MRIWIYTGGRKSNSARELVDADDNFRRLVEGKGFKSTDVVVNWGTTHEPPVKAAKVINSALAVSLCINKYHTFAALAGKDIDTVPWTTNKAVAQEWQDKGRTVVARMTLTGHSGAGILIIEPGQPIPDAPLYTQYVFKEKEFRIHATQTEVFDTRRKIRDPKVEPTDWKIRSAKNGFIFAAKNVDPSAVRDQLAIDTVKVLGLDFGAVDIVEDKHGKFFVLEVNTAPGLEGQTIKKYNAILEKLANVG